ncbi:MAG: glucose-1-phosphate thymidylyltransferase RfbA [Micavibrio sp.]|nr:glucose-1-phosphate thymidylyltransferase RfbA [Micavibrio sp.]
MAIKKGIILAAGKATRLHPTSLAFGKQLMAIYDKPMIYYPLATLMAAGIRDVLIIVTPRDKPLFETLLGNGSQWGISISYAEQHKQDGIAGAFLIGEKFIGGDNCCLILGDNFFHGPGLDGILKKAGGAIDGARIFCCHVDEPSAYGVAVLDAAGKVTRLVEKPKELISNWCATGLYFYDNQACEIAKSLKPSARGELEITDLNIRYLEQGKLSAVTLDASYHWFDLGTHGNIHDASQFIRDHEKRTGKKIGCLDEVAYTNGLISREQLMENASKIGNPAYAEYIRNVAVEAA